MKCLRTPVLFVVAAISTWLIAFSVFALSPTAEEYCAFGFPRSLINNFPYCISVLIIVPYVLSPFAGLVLFFLGLFSLLSITIWRKRIPRLLRLLSISILLVGVFWILLFLYFMAAGFDPLASFKEWQQDQIKDIRTPQPSIQTAPRAPLDSGISGIVYCCCSAPCSPSFAPSGAENPRPEAHADLLVSDTDGNIVARIDSDAEGRFSVPFSPGTYFITGMDASGVSPLRPGPSIVVYPHEFSEVELWIDGRSAEP